MKENDFKLPSKKASKRKPQVIEKEDEVLTSKTGGYEDRPIAYKPFPGPQTEFLKSTEKYVLFSGGRGSGKSLAMLAAPLRFVHHPTFRGLIIRKTIKDLRDLINKSKSMYQAAYPGVKWKEQDKLFEFPSGAKIEYNYFEQEKDADQYQGQEFDYIGIDEVTQYPSSYIMETLSPCLRGNTHIPKWMRLTTNPNGAGRAWVKETFIDKADPGVTIKQKVSFDGQTEEITYKWFTSTVRDNQALMDQGYGISLANIKNETLRKQWLDGDWDSADGLAFDEFKESIHVVKPFEVPRGWVKFRACDWGYSSMAVCLWFAVSPDNKLYVYRELTTSLVNADIFAHMILEREERENIRYGVLDSSCWHVRGNIGETIAETMIKEGCRWMPSDRSKGARIAGKMLVHKYLQGQDFKPDSRVIESPDLFIFDTCKELIKELSSLPLDPKNPEDVDTNAVDHAYDTLRYGLSSRPQFRSQDFFAEENRHISQDLTFGY